MTKDRTPAMRPCPTCGTLGYCQPQDEHDGADYATPNEAILRGLAALEQGLPGLLRNDIQYSYELVEEIFRAMFPRG